MFKSIKSVVKFSAHVALDVVELGGELQYRVLKRSGLMKRYVRLIGRISGTTVLFSDAATDKIFVNAEAQNRKMFDIFHDGLEGGPVLKPYAALVNEAVMQGMDMAVQPLVADSVN